MCDFLLVIIELFSLGAVVLSQFTHVTDGQTNTFAIGKTTCTQCSVVNMKIVNAAVIFAYLH